MLKIYKIDASPVIDFAAEELKKYLRMMMPNDGEITIEYKPDAREGFRLGLMQTFGLDVSDAENTELDDILYMDTDGEGGIIAGDNARSVLLAVYEYLRQNGCRFLFPGVDGELIPVKKIEAVKYRFKPSMRYRGQVNESATSHRAMLETIDFGPKVGQNCYMIQFLIPGDYYNQYYRHNNNRHRTPEPLTEDQVLQYKRHCEVEIAKRGLQFHDAGHGFTIEPFGISSTIFDARDEAMYPKEAIDCMAMIGGKRGFFKPAFVSGDSGLGYPIYTNFCKSNPAARKKVVDYIIDYARRGSNVDYLHIWESDGASNQCECEACQKKSASDWYVQLLNEVDAEMTRLSMRTRIVFIGYADTIYAPEVERIHNPDRFTFMLAPISRSYTSTLPEPIENATVYPYCRNKPLGKKRKNLSDFLAYGRAWRKIFPGASFIFEYYFWTPQYRDPSSLALAKRIREDIFMYRDEGYEGILEDGSQRSYFPTGFPFYLYSRMLYDLSLTYEEIAEEYFSAAFGEGWRDFYSYLEAIEKAFDIRYLSGELSADEAIGAYYNPSLLKGFEGVEDICKKAEAAIKKHYDMPYRAQTVSVRLIEKHVTYCRMLAGVLACKCVGDDAAAKAALDTLWSTFDLLEYEMEANYDHSLCMAALNRIVKAPTDLSAKKKREEEEFATSEDLH